MCLAQSCYRGSFGWCGICISQGITAYLKLNVGCIEKMVMSLFVFNTEKYILHLPIVSLKLVFRIDKSSYQTINPKYLQFRFSDFPDKNCPKHFIWVSWQPAAVLLKNAKIMYHISWFQTTSDLVKLYNILTNRFSKRS